MCLWFEPVFWAKKRTRTLTFLRVQLKFIWRKRGDSLRDIQIITCFNFILFLHSFFVTMSLSRRGCKQPFHRLFGRLAFVVVYGIVCKPTPNPFESPFGNVKTKRTGKNLPVRFVWRKRGDSNPWAREDYTISNRARYDHFDTLPYYVFILKLCRDFYRQLFYFICFLFKCQLFFKRFIKLFKVFWFFAPLRQLLRFPCSAYFDINHLQNKLRYDIIRYGEFYGSHRI